MDPPSPQLWATASREWYIPPKPKPGRKPKKDVAPPAAQSSEVDAKGRRVQNRAAQRAFRERKQTQLADLQARVQSYEQGEVQRNLALQNVALRLKQENDTLRQENAALKERLAHAEQERNLAQDIAREAADRKRYRDDSPASSIGSSQRKKHKVDHREPDVQAPRFAQSYISSPTSMVSSPDSLGSTETCFSSVPFDSHQDTFHAAAFPGLKTEPSSFPAFDCGFCSDNSLCVCRDVFQPLPEVKMALSNDPSIIVLDNPAPVNEPSILDNLPPYQPPVPLRIRPKGTRPTNPIFEITPACSGDPANCPACADDSFGKAFCEKISTLPPCGDCSCPSVADTMPDGNMADSSPPPETMPTSDAWRRLKSHPNVSFSDLDMLADVVARRSKCTGPRVLLSPEPEAGSSSDQPILLTDPHASYRQQQLVREVSADAVREALCLLDGKYIPQ
ncbi:unnamed protein product [Mycena citricolor]|uniref:BZIP domain-containing protein n=1 Tax=Mycena citricolor TaxID=2018698 RepID=A0AAD2HSH5_9AGAR|nr:unnamed protein product [Mycena citricolor]